MSIEEAADKAIEECIRVNILHEFLERNRAEETMCMMKQEWEKAL